MESSSKFFHIKETLIEGKITNPCMIWDMSDPSSTPLQRSQKIITITIISNMCILPGVSQMFFE